MLISAFYADQANYKNSALNAYHQANAVLCLSARLMLIIRTICVLGTCWGTEELGWNERSREEKLRDVK
jgi:hypothetical protein